MQIGIRAHDCKADSFEGLVSEIERQGFSCAHLALTKAVKEFPVDRGAMTPGMAIYMKRVFEKKGVDIAVLGCYLNLATPDPVQLAEFTETYKAHIRFASLLGCGVVGTETGAVNVEYQFEPANHSEEALAIFIKNLKPVVEYAEKMGVILAIEPVYVHIVSTVEKARRVLDEINSPNLQIIFDPVNLLSPDNYQAQDEIIEKAFALLGNDIAVIHAKDFRIEEDMVKSVEIGTGIFHYDVLMKQVKTRKPFIHVTLEDTKPENALQSKAFIQKMYQNS